MSVTVKTIKPVELSRVERETWIKLRSSNPALYSPYFHPSYTELVGTLKDDAYVAVISRNGTPVSFFPFQGPRPGKSGFARPIGAPMTDYHGFIEAPGSGLDHLSLLKDIGIGAFHFSALTGPLSESHGVLDSGVMMDISKGLDAWRNERDSSYRRHLKSNRRRIRKAEEEFGPRRFAFKSHDQNIFNDLINWKREKFYTTGKYDVLSVDWTMQLLEQLWQSEDELRCDMHALYFGEKLAAIDLGLTDGDVFHSWIVAYDSDLHSLCPGIQLLEGLIDEAPDLGYSKIDLGAGLNGYKRHYGTENVQVGSGFIAVKGPAAALSQLYGHAEEFGKKSLKDAPGKLRRRYSQIAACDNSFSGRAKAMINAVKTSQK